MIDRRVSEVDTAANPEAAARVARVARRFFGAELPSVVGAQEPVLIARPDQADADALEVAVVLGTRVDAAVFVDPDTAMLEVRGEVQLLVLGTERQEPAQLGARQIARVARSFARRVGAHAVWSTEGEVLRGVEVVERILAAGRKQEIRAVVEILTAQDVCTDLVVGAERLRRRKGIAPRARRIIADMADLVLEAPIRRALAVLLIAVERENARMARLVGVLADFRDVAVLILDVAVLIADARVEVVALAALDGVVEAERSDARMAECVEALIVITELDRPRARGSGSRSQGRTRCSPSSGCRNCRWRTGPVCRCVD